MGSKNRVELMNATICPKCLRISRGTGYFSPDYLCKCRMIGSAPMGCLMIPLDELFNAYYERRNNGSSSGGEKEREDAAHKRE